MAKNLVIVESPAKSKTIHKILGRDFQVMASMGHIFNLPKNRLGIDVTNDFKPTYEIIPEREKTVKEIKKAAKKADKVYLATDLDREGEAIAAHLAQALDLPDEKTFRVTFNEITPTAIKRAIDKPGKISDAKVDAQKARRILDRLVGYKISPLLWSKIMTGLSAGRVQSVALKLVTERELEIRAFEPEEYWEIDAKLEPADDKTKKLEAKLKKLDGKDPKISNQEQADKLVKHLKKQDFVISKVEKKKTRSKPQPPFITSTMQQRASTKLYFSPKKTMMIAQQLYEGIEIQGGSTGLITYMRTDSVSVAKDAQENTKKFIEKKLGTNYLPKRPNRYKSKKSAQEAHEAIRPTIVAQTPDSLKKYLTKDQFKLYKLIWERFVASQMAPAIYDTTNIEITADNGMFQTRGRILVFDGFLKVYSAGEEDSKQPLLPDVKEGEKLKLEELIPSQHFTKPPPRYSEASLVRTLEKEGIGRPSTYAVILSNIQARKYLEIKKRAIYATDLGILVVDRLKKHFARIMDSKFTSRMEQKLDKVEEHKQDWVKVLKDFYKTLEKELAAAGKNMKGLNAEPEMADEVCEKCGKKMQYLWRRSPNEGIVKFMGCSGYPDCKNTRSVHEDEDELEIEGEHKCKECGNEMVLRRGRTGKFLGCSQYPDCKFTMAIDKEGKPIELPEVDEECEKCGKDMTVKFGRHGPFLACTGYPGCKNAKPLKGKDGPKAGTTTDIECEKCGKPLAVKYGRRGKFLACTGYPECKNAKPISLLQNSSESGGDDKKGSSGKSKKAAAKKKAGGVKKSTKSAAKKKSTGKKKSSKSTAKKKTGDKKSSKGKK